MTGTQVAERAGVAVRTTQWRTAIGRLGRVGRLGRSLFRVPLVARRSRLTGMRGLAGVKGLTGMRGRVKDAGMATAEYAIATLAAVGFAGLLIVVLRSDEVRGLLTGIIRQALSV